MDGITKNTGLIIKCVGGDYYVETPSGVSAYKARGVFRNRGITPLAGDRAVVDGGVITEILPRKNSIIRPPLANLDQLVFVVSVCEPKPNLTILDKFLAVAAYKEIERVIVFTKTDLAECKEQIAFLTDVYKNAAEVITVDYSSGDGSGVAQVREILAGKISAFTGNSGVGKSTLLNKLNPHLALETGEISEKLGRGRHTTRHSELYRLGGGYIADTPGFSTFDFIKYERIDRGELAACFPEFSDYTGHCRFRDCSHIKESGCAVIGAAEAGKIPPSRHNSYKVIYAELAAARYN